MMRSYEAARSLFSFLGFIAWSVVVIGGLVAMVSAAGASKYGGGGAGLLAMVPGMGIGIAGFIFVAFVQMGRATVDTAEYTQQILKLSRDQLEVSQQSLKAQNTAPQTFEAAGQKGTTQETKASFASQADKTSPKGQLIDQSTIYRGKTIRDEKGKFLYKGLSFDTLLAAKNHIDALAEPATRQLPDPSKET